MCAYADNHNAAVPCSRIRHIRCQVSSRSYSYPPEFLLLAFDDLHAHAAVDRQAGTGNEARLVGAKENGGVGHVADLTQPAKRRLPDDPGDGGADVRG